MNTSRSHHISMFGRAALGALLTAGAIAVPFSASAETPAARAPSDAECLPLLCVSVDLELEILGGAPTTPRPTLPALPLPTLPTAPTSPPATAPAPTTPTAPSLPQVGIVDLDLDLAIHADLGDLATVDAHVPVSVGVGSNSQHPVAVDAAASPDISTTLGRRGAPIAAVDVSSVDLVADVAVANPASGGLHGLAAAGVTDVSCLVGVGVVGTTRASCTGSALVGLDAGIVAIGAGVDFCNVSVAVLGAADRATCAAATDDGIDDATDRPTTAPGDETSSDPGDSNGSASDVPLGEATVHDAEGPAGIRRSQADDAQDGAGLAVTGSSVMVLLALGAAATATGFGSLAIRRRRPA